MLEQLRSFIETIKTNSKISTFDEAATKQAIILPILHQLGWNTYDIDEVAPEFSVENKKVDYSLRYNNENKFFVEVKKTSEELRQHQEQLLDYSFRIGIEQAILTNGVTWWFYLPMKGGGSWEERKYFTIDIFEQEAADATSKFIDLLGKENVLNGSSLENAESIFSGKMKTKVIEEALPESWNKLITEPDGNLVNLILDTTERLCGYKPELNDVKKFIEKNESKFLLLPTDEVLPISSKKTLRTRRIRGQNEVPQKELTRLIIEILRARGHRAQKTEVENEIYNTHKKLFDNEYYQESIAHGIERWKHNVAWAKERAKHQGLIKKPSESGRGIWELTEKGKVIQLGEI